MNKETKNLKKVGNNKSLSGRREEIIASILLILHLVSSGILQLFGLIFVGVYFLLIIYLGLYLISIYAIVSVFSNKKNSIKFLLISFMGWLLVYLVPVFLGPTIFGVPPIPLFYSLIYFFIMGALPFLGLILTIICQVRKKKN
jgi:hypothetical protein